MDPNADPGWRSALRYSAFGLVPGWGLRLRKNGSDGLALLRGMFLSFTSAFVLVGVAVVVLETGADLEGSVPGAPAAAVVFVIGLGSLAGSRLERPLDCEDDARVAKSYTQRFFLRVALAEVAALAGFAAFVVTGSGWLYAVGAAFTAAGFLQIAPTAGRLREDEDRLHASGCARSLVAALRQNPPGPRQVSR